MSNELTREELNALMKKGWSYRTNDDCVNFPDGNGTVGQFAVSDGAGGITWKTLHEAEEVSY